MSTHAPPVPPKPVSATPARRLTDVDGAPATVIGPGTHIKGHLSGGDSVDLSGTLEGDSRISGLYRVRESARVVGDIAATSIVVDGEVSGRTLVAETVEIGAGARVRAHVRAHTVAIAEGAFFDGHVHMEGRSGPAGAPTSFREKRRGRGRGQPQTPGQ